MKATYKKTARQLAVDRQRKHFITVLGYKSAVRPEFYKARLEKSKQWNKDNHERCAAASRRYRAKIKARYSTINDMSRDLYAGERFISKLKKRRELIHAARKEVYRIQNLPNLTPAKRRTRLMSFAIYANHS